MFSHAYSYAAFHEIRSTLRRTVEPAGAIVTPAEVLRELDIGEDDAEQLAEAMDLIPEAVALVESDTPRSLMPQTWELTLDQFPREIELRRPPIDEVVSIEYLDAAGVSQTVDAADYQVDANTAPGRIRPLVDWPATWVESGFVDLPMNVVTVTFTAGYQGAIPPLARRAVLRAAKAMYYNCWPDAPYDFYLSRLRWTM